MKKLILAVFALSAFAISSAMAPPLHQKRMHPLAPAAIAVHAVMFRGETSVRTPIRMCGWNCCVMQRQSIAAPDFPALRKSPGLGAGGFCVGLHRVARTCAQMAIMPINRAMEVKAAASSTTARNMGIS